MTDIKIIINQCLKRSMPPVPLYTEGEDGYHMIAEGIVADIESATKNLKTALEPLLMGEKENDKINLLINKNNYLKGKINAYETILRINGTNEGENNGKEV